MPRRLSNVSSRSGKNSTLRSSRRVLKNPTSRLVIVACLLYFATLVLARGSFPQDFNPPIYFLVIPLLLAIGFLVVGLSNSATVPREPLEKELYQSRMTREIVTLTRQIQVATGASQEYYDGVLRARLRDILAEKVCLETGIERQKVNALLQDEKQAPRLLRDVRLCRLLYSREAGMPAERVRMLLEAVQRIEEWKP